MKFWKTMRKYKHLQSNLHTKYNHLTSTIYQFFLCCFALWWKFHVEWIVHAICVFLYIMYTSHKTGNLMFTDQRRMRCMCKCGFGFVNSCCLWFSACLCLAFLLFCEQRASHLLCTADGKQWQGSGNSSLHVLLGPQLRLYMYIHF